MTRAAVITGTTAHIPIVMITATLMDLAALPKGMVPRAVPRTAVL